MTAKKRAMRSQPQPAAGEKEGAPLLHTQLTLIEVTESETLEELLADRRLAPLIAARLSDRVAIAAPGCTKELLQRLLKAGHTPKLIER